MLKTFDPNFQCPEARAIRLMADKPPGSLPDLFFNPYTSRPNHYPIRLLAVGIPEGVDSVIYELYASRFAEVDAWSQQIPARYPGEIMRIMTRDFVLRR